MCVVFFNTRRYGPSWQASISAIRCANERAASSTINSVTKHAARVSHVQLLFSASRTDPPVPQQPGLFGVADLVTVPETSQKNKNKNTHT